MPYVYGQLSLEWASRKINYFHFWVTIHLSFLESIPLLLCDFCPIELRTSLLWIPAQQISNPGFYSGDRRHFFHNVFRTDLPPTILKSNLFRATLSTIHRLGLVKSFSIMATSIAPLTPTSQACLYRLRTYKAPPEYLPSE